MDYMRTSWHESKTGNHQGLIIDDKTGDNIAVTYDKQHASLVAAAPELLHMVVTLLGVAQWALDNGGNPQGIKPIINRAYTIIKEAKGQN